MSDSEPIPTWLSTAEERVRYGEARKRAIDGARWFYWVALLSLPGTVVAMLGRDGGFAISLGSTLPLNAFALHAPTFEYKTLYALSALTIMAIFYGLGRMAAQRRAWAFQVGIALYAIDALLMLFLFNEPLILGFVLHVIFGYFMVLGLLGVRALQREFSPDREGKH